MNYYLLFHKCRIYLPFMLINFMIYYIILIYSWNYLFYYVITEIPRKYATKINDYYVSSLFNYMVISSYYKTIIILFFLLFYFWFIMMMVSLYKASFSNPGFLPDIFNYELKDFIQNNLPKETIKVLTKFDSLISNGPLTKNEIIKEKHLIHKTISKNEINFLFNNKSINDFSLCSICLRKKPERSHHCRKCDKCVQKMDHHCPWIGNCIGKYNYKYFILLIIYGFNVSFSIFTSYFPFIIFILKEKQFSFCYCLTNCVAFSFNIIFLGFMMYLIYCNFDLVVTNMTLIEKAECERFDMTNSYDKNAFNKNAFNKQISYHMRHKYDKGIINNLKDVFGDNCFMWLIPL